MADNLYQRNEIWWLKIQVAGTLHRRSLRTRSRAVAKKEAAKIIAELNEHAVTGEQRHTYDEAAKRWYKERLPSIEPSTARRYIASAKHFSPVFKGLYLDSIKARQIADFVSKRKAEGATDPTIRRDITALSSLLTSAVGWGWIDTNHAKTWDRSTLAESEGRIVRIDQASFDAIAEEAPPALAAIMRFLLLTGMRLEEVAAATWKNYDRSAGTMFIPKTKTHSPRTIELLPEAKKLLDKLPVSLATPYIFTHREGGRYVSASSLFGKVRKRVAADRPDLQLFRLHDLRHEFAARWLKAGMSIYDLSRYLGHKSVMTTERHYLRFVPTGHVERIRREGTKSDTGTSGQKRGKSQKSA